MAKDVARDIETVVITALARQLHIAPEAVAREARPVDLGLDSVGMLELVFALEEALEIQVPYHSQEADLATAGFHIDTVQDLIDSVARLALARD